MYFQDGKVAVTKISAVLLCMYAQSDVGLGMLKYKVHIKVHIKSKIHRVGNT